jgi:hypothetical protein
MQRTMAARERQPDVLRLRGVQNVLVLRPSPWKQRSDQAPHQRETQRETESAAKQHVYLRGTSGTTNSWTTPRCRSWTVTLWLATGAPAGRGACCNSEARARVSLAVRGDDDGTSDAEPTRMPGLASLLHRHGPLPAPTRALRKAHCKRDFIQQTQLVGYRIGKTGPNERAEGGLSPRTYVVAAGQAIVAHLLLGDAGGEVGLDGGCGLPMPATVSERAGDEK